MGMNQKAKDTSKGIFGFADRLSPSMIAGLVLAPLGAWVAVQPFLFGGWSWDWHSGRYMLSVIPGVVAMVGGLIMLSGRDRAASAGGGLALAAGLWLVVGPVFYTLFAGTELGTLSGGESIRMLQWMPFFFGAGALASLLASYGLGLIAPMQFADEEWSDSATTTTTTRRRVPAPTERPRRQRGVKEPVGGRVAPKARAKGPRT